MRPDRKHVDAAAVWPARTRVEVEAPRPIAEPERSGLLTDEDRLDVLTVRIFDPRDDLRRRRHRCGRAELRRHEVEIHHVTTCLCTCLASRQCERREGERPHTTDFGGHLEHYC